LRLDVIIAAIAMPSFFHFRHAADFRHYFTPRFFIFFHDTAILRAQIILRFYFRFMLIDFPLSLDARHTRAALALLILRLPDDFFAIFTTSCRFLSICRFIFRRHYYARKRRMNNAIHISLNI
jgi:hypothetical protein